MMATGLDFFTVELQTPTGQVLPSIEYDGQRYFVGEPGQEFVVKVTRSMRYPNKLYRAQLLVDGKDAGVWGYLGREKEPFKFEGWLTASTPDCMSYNRFKFASCQPSTAAATVRSADDLAAGRIEVQLKEVVDTGRDQQDWKPWYGSVPCSDADKKLPDGKKWFMAPGLKADAGSSTKGGGSNKRVYQEVSSLPSLHVRYDSSEALYLRKALLPRFAPHRAILRKSANPAIAALGVEPATASAAAAAATTAAGGGRVKREAAGVKRELEGGDDDDYVPRSATAANRIDLTEEPVQPMRVNGRQLAPDELAVCDLCDSDGEGASAPKWEVQKKQCVAVDL